MENTSNTPNQMVYTKKELKSMLMPVVDTVINDKYKVIYNNLGKLRFTASYKEMPPNLYEDITLEDKIYEVGYIDDKKKVFTATLKNIKQEILADDMQDGVTKVI